MVGGLIQNPQLRIGEQCPGQRNLFPLPARQLRQRGEQVADAEAEAVEEAPAEDDK